jgi:signal transduction histidine kinase
MSKRLLASYLSVALFVLLVLEIPLGIYYSRNERTALEDKVEHDASTIASLANGASTARLEQLARKYRHDTGGRVIVVDSHGRLLVDSNTAAPRPRSYASRPEVARALGGNIAAGVRHSTTLRTNLLYVAVPVAAGGDVRGAVRITYPTSAVDRRVHRYWLILAAVAGVVLTVVAVVGLRFARSITRPLRRLQEAVGAAGAGDLRSRAPVATGPPEVRALARDFNDMAGKLEQLLDSQRAFVADASHQLRTPLTALSLRLENLSRDVTQPGLGELEGAQAEVERLRRLVDGLLALARADTDVSRSGDVDLADTVSRRLDAWSALAAERGVALVDGLESPISVLASPERLDQVLDNLVANALEVSAAGGSITVTARRQEEWVELHVADEGPGMTAEEREHAFDRFWRGRDDRSGFGLGLPIVARLVEADSGEVALGQSPGGGLDVVVRLRSGAGDAARGDLSTALLPARG